MRITLGYFAQIRQAAGVESETLDVAEGVTALEALKTVSHGAGFREVLFDESNALRSVILFVVNEIPVRSDRILTEGDCLQVFSPVAGG